MSQVDRDAVVVGGGILGLMVAVLLAETGRDVDVLESPAREPRSDSQRNHSWLQSGLLYPGNIIARSMYYDGLAMLDHFGVSAPANRGIFRFSTELEAKNFLDHAQEIRLRGKVQKVSDIEARGELGILYQSGKVHFRVPDAPFPEAQIMELARARAQRFGVRFRQCRATLERDLSSETGYVLLDEETRLVPRLTVVCAGAGTPRLLESLAITHHLVVNQSVLLVIYDLCGMSVPLLADRTTGLTVVAWDASEIPPAGRIVVGAGDRRELTSKEQDLVRKVSPEEQAFLTNLLSPTLHLRKGNHRFTAGQKTDVQEDGRSRVQPWIYECPDFPGLIFATPGKATLAFGVAQRILDLASRYARALAPGGPPGPTESPSSSSPGKAIKPHHDPQFDIYDERERTS